nr:RNA-directed DNA polymerase, eukaryota, reverse transcriptase zinc-binding domain protein [Tanacetum cinerariifolium]
MGLAVSVEKVEEVTRHIGCGILNTPFSFLGSKVRGCMSRIKSWDEVIDKMVNRLSKWKMKTLSIRGRLTLLKVVDWVSWNKVLTSKEKGGFGVSSLFALNRVLMFKWVWRFFNQRDSLWVRVIHAIHGVDGSIGRAGNVRYILIWCDIINEIDRMPRSGIEFEQWDHLLNNLEGVMLNLSEDRWSWDLNGSEEFSVASARRIGRKTLFQNFNDLHVKAIQGRNSIMFENPIQRGNGPTMLEEHFIIKLEGSLLGDCDVEKTVGGHIHMRLEAKSSERDSGYGNDRSITGYELMIQGCAVTWEAILQHMTILLTIEVVYMALTEAVKETIWLKGLWREIGAKLMLVAVVATGALKKAVPSPRFQNTMKLLCVHIKK